VRLPLAVAALLVAGAPIAALAGEPASAPPPPAVDRRAAAEAGTASFRELLFFAEGRGLHAGPSLGGGPDADGPLSKLALAFAKRTGFVVEDGRVLGLHEVETSGHRVSAVGCVACHGGRAAGKTIVGLGNKTIDVFEVGRLGRKSLWLAKVAGAAKDEAGKELLDSAGRLADLLTDPRFANATAGLVPTSMVFQWFYAQASEPIPPGIARGAVKVPALWGYARKREVGQFCDGFGDGHAAGWTVGVELAGGQIPETVRTYRAKLDEVERQFATFLPPPYPFPVDAAKAARGKTVFESTCSACHGTYSRAPDGLPAFEPPQHVAWETVGTDRERLDAVGGPLRKLVARSPLADLIRTTDLPPGYFAPRLEGVWSRFPFLHNASVPTLRALLTDPAKRPTEWSLEDAGEADRFDPVAVGLTLPAPGSPEASALARRAADGDRLVSSTSRLGQSSAGHSFGTDLSPSAKADLLEYLKSL
jgi:cytochrome c5